MPSELSYRMQVWTLASPLDLLEDWAAAQAVLRELDVGHAPVIEYDTLLPPLRWPRKVICAGVNYRKHMREMGGEIPAAGWRPFFFLKAPTTSVIGPRDPIVISEADRARYDWEAELAVVIGVRGKNIDPERAGFHAAAYSVCNDITARGYHRRDAAPADAFSYDWFAAKSMEGSLPLGPGLTPAFLVPDPQDLRLRLWVNGELQQDESTADMVCTVAELIAAEVYVAIEDGVAVALGDLAVGHAGHERQRVVGLEHQAVPDGGPVEFRLARHVDRQCVRNEDH